MKKILLLSFLLLTGCVVEISTTQVSHLVYEPVSNVCLVTGNLDWNSDGSLSVYTKTSNKINLPSTVLTAQINEDLDLDTAKDILNVDGDCNDIR